MNILMAPFTIGSTSNIFSGDAKYRRMKNNSNLAPLAQDTVSFTSKKTKQIEDDADCSKAKDKNDDDSCHKINYDMACDIHEECKPETRELIRLLTHGLKNVIETDAHPDNPIMKGTAGIHGRAKSPESLMDKVPPRKLKNKEEIYKMGDVIGARIVLKDSSRESFDKVFKELGQMVRTGKLKVLEVENYRLQPQDSYVSGQTLSNFEKTCNKAGLFPKITSQPQKSGYTGIHITVELPSGKLAEIQIMGRDMERLKDLEDFYYKKKCNKTIQKKYKPIDDMLNQYLGKCKKVDGQKRFEKLNDIQNIILDKYITDSYKRARNIPVRESNRKDNSKDYFLPIPYFLPEELSFENLERMKAECERKNK